MYTYTTIREIVDKLNLEILNEGNWVCNFWFFR